MMFQADGMPVRARLTCTFIEVRRSGAGGQGGQPADARTSPRSHVVDARRDAERDRGRRSTATRRLWRPIALANRHRRPAARSRVGAARCGSRRCRSPTPRPARWCAEMVAARRLRAQLHGPHRRRAAAAAMRASIIEHAPPGRHRGRRPRRADARQRRPAVARPSALATSTTPFELDLGYAPGSRSRRVFVGEITGVERRVPVGRHADRHRGRPRLPAAADDRHQGPGVRAQPAVHRQVPAPRPGRHRHSSPAPTC